ncbi:MAG TPA: HPF/RaiA family ribosome-associated protein [Kofleriaceae bacterium]|jgi:ribosome-associated translation inhibitor RaiA|nr:HPF/RaiA family ribosome-associated protein [Kofleriaceae bacterium]
MSFPIEIHFRGMTPSESVERQVREWAEKLETTSSRVLRCVVALELPHKHHRHGARFDARVELAVPGTTLVVSGEHEDAHGAIKDAFEAARRRLHDHVESRREGARA